MEGLTLRDVFAVAALIAIGIDEGIAGPDDDNDDQKPSDPYFDKFRARDATRCYLMADAMLAARETQ